MRIDFRGEDRGRTSADGVEGLHAFSFGRHHDPARLGWGALRVANELRLAPGADAGVQRLANMEALVLVLDGVLAVRHGDAEDMRVAAGGWAWTGAGHGLDRGLRNADASAPLHLLEFRIQPGRVNLAPVHARAVPAWTDGDWTPIASPDGADGGLPLRQQAWLRGLRLRAGASQALVLAQDRQHWLQVVAGDVSIDGRAAAAGDAVAFADGSATPAFAATTDAVLLHLDLPG